MKALTQKQRKQFTDAADRVKSTNARSHRVPKLEAKLQAAYDMLQDSHAVLIALASAESSRNYYKTHIKNHAELAPGHIITEVVRNHQIQKIDDFLKTRRSPL